MGGVYGDMLAHFPELMKTYEVFKMEPRIGGGYGERYDVRKIRGYWSWRRSGKMDVEGDLRTVNYQATFWVQEYSFFGGKVLIEQNEYVEAGGDVFLIVQRDDFTHEGGFYKCFMKRLVGPTDRQITNMKVDKAIRSDY